MMEFSFEQMVRPFGIWTGGYQPHLEIIGEALTTNGVLLRIVASAQSILTLGLLAEVFLAIRWRFRRG